MSIILHEGVTDQKKISPSSHKKIAWHNKSIKLNADNITEEAFSVRILNEVTSYTYKETDCTYI